MVILGALPMAAAENIDDQIDDQFNESADNVREANKNSDNLLKDAISFPIGLTMRAEHVRDNGSKYGMDDIAYSNLTHHNIDNPKYQVHVWSPQGFIRVRPATGLSRVVRGVGFEPTNTFVTGS